MLFRRVCDRSWQVLVTFFGGARALSIRPTSANAVFALGGTPEGALLHDLESVSGRLYIHVRRHRITSWTHCIFFFRSVSFIHARQWYT